MQWVKVPSLTFENPKTGNLYNKCFCLKYSVQVSVRTDRTRVCDSQNQDHNDRLSSLNKGGGIVVTVSRKYQSIICDEGHPLPHSTPSPAHPFFLLWSLHTKFVFEWSLGNQQVVSSSSDDEKQILFFVVYFCWFLSLVYTRYLVIVNRLTW